MRRRLLIALLALFFFPVLLLAWAGWRLARHEEQQLAEQSYRLAEQQCETHILEIQEVIVALSLDLDDLTRNLSVREAAETLSTDPRVGSVFVNMPTNDVVYPENWRDSLGKPLLDVLSRGELARPMESGDMPFGWYSWFTVEGMHLVRWWRADRGYLLGVELNGARLAADVIAKLPTGEGAPDSGTLVDENGKVVYTWGRQPGNGVQPGEVVRALPAPLNAWQIHQRISLETGYLRGTVTLAMSLGFFAAIVTLAFLLVYVTREYRRDLQEASRRVTFVNQVSHELKTPLTNIRMYAELLQQSTPADDPEGARKIGVIVEESGRLTRLIENVLTFARDQRQRVVLHRREAALDDLVHEVTERFRLSLEKAGIELETDLAAPSTLSLDSDAIGQILGNLLANAEKYAPGAPLSIQTGEDREHGWVTIHDGGPGVPASAAERIFLPFERLDNALTSGATGAGIGLTIARNLARLHGGDLRLIATDRGACFQLTLPKEKQP